MHTVQEDIQSLNDTLEIIAWIFDTFDNNSRTGNDFTKYLKESCR